MHDNVAEEDELIAHVSKGDRAALATLLTNNHKVVLVFVKQWMDPELSARVDPDDIVQETFAEAIKRIPGYLSDRKMRFRAWLMLLSRGQLAHARRTHLLTQKRSVRREIGQEPAVDDPAAATSALAQVPSFDKTPSSIFRHNESNVNCANGFKLLEEQQPLAYQILMLFRDLQSLTEVAKVTGLSLKEVVARQQAAVDFLAPFCDSAEKREARTRRRQRIQPPPGEQK